MAFHSAATETADRLSKIGGFDPVLMRVEDVDRSGEYLLLPIEQAQRWDQAQIQAARQAVRVDLTPTASEGVETAAYLVAVNGVVCGRWSTGATGGAMDWWHGERVLMGDFATDIAAITAAARPSIPTCDIAAIRLSIPASRVVLSE